MWGNKRQRYVFRKRSKRGQILWLLIGTLILVGLI
jgi:predicted nucleic acid-binding Zn ribbon protein